MSAVAVSQKRRDVDMTEGSTLRHLINFAIPLLFGNLFQQLYNMVDTWVVGNYGQGEAFSAVGTVGPIINTLIGFFVGFSSGASVVISQYYGAGDEKKVSKAVHTSIIMTLIFGVIFTVVGILMVPFMLDLMKTPDTVKPQATVYLTVYFAGIVGLLIYNIGSGILRAVGDSRRPFYFLVVSAVINTVLDLVFVLAFNMDVFGVALATVIAQGVSAILVLFTLFRSKNCVKLSLKEFKISPEMLKKIIVIGLPAALQMMITSFSNVFVQSYINYFGEDFMSGWTAYSKIDQLLLLPMQSVALASTTFVGQNLGKDQVKRARGGVKTAILLSVAITLVLMIPVMIFSPYLVMFFNPKEAVVTNGAMLLRLISPFYVLCCINQIFAGALRGSGNTRAPMVILLFSFVFFRQLYLFIVANYISNTVTWIAMAYPAGWLVASTTLLIYYRTCDFSSKLIKPKREEA
ncbi:MAG: MATE family efflux transporter [Clostridia bacterium]|nr:MATE family efflux transporter [Clostridia bacterium]